MLEVCKTRVCVQLKLQLTTLIMSSFPASDKGNGENVIFFLFTFLGKNPPLSSRLRFAFLHLASCIMKTYSTQHKSTYYRRRNWILYLTSLDAPTLSVPPRNF